MGARIQGCWEERLRGEAGWGEGVETGNEGGRRESWRGWGRERGERSEACLRGRQWRFREGEWEGSLEYGEGWATRMAGDGGRRDERKGRSVEEMILPEVELGMAGDGDAGGDDGSAAVRRRRQRRRQLEDGGVAMTAEKNPWPGQGVAAVVTAAAAAVTAAATAVGLFPRPSLRSHLRGRALFSFFK